MVASISVALPPLLWRTSSLPRLRVKIPIRYFYQLYVLLFLPTKCVNMPLKTNKNLPMVARSVLSPVCRVLGPSAHSRFGRRSVWTSHPLSACPHIRDGLTPDGDGRCSRAFPRHGRVSSPRRPHLPIHTTKRTVWFFSRSVAPSPKLGRAAASERSRQRHHSILAQHARLRWMRTPRASFGVERWVMARAQSFPQGHPAPVLATRTCAYERGLSGD